MIKNRQKSVMNSIYHYSILETQTENFEVQETTKVQKVVSITQTDQENLQQEIKFLVKSFSQL